MKELLELVNTRINSMIDDGTIEKMIEERATEAVTKILDDSFRPYGKLHKVLEEKIGESIDGSALRFQIEPYTQAMNRYAQQQVAKYFESEAKEKIEESLSEIFEPVPSETTLQELVTMVAKSFKDDDYDNHRDEHLSVECAKSEYGWYELKFWKKKSHDYSFSRSSSDRDADIQMHVGKDGDIRWLEGGSRYCGLANYGTEAILYRMAAKKTLITDIRECDQDDFDDTYIGIGEDY